MRPRAHGVGRPTRIWEARGLLKGKGGLARRLEARPGGLEANWPGGQKARSIGDQEDIMSAGQDNRPDNQLEVNL